MPWCLNCKEEYVEGKTHCIECGAELVEELIDAPELVSFMETEKEKLAHKFVEFLHYSKIENASYQFDEETQLWKVLIEKSAQTQAKKLYNAFYSVEAEHVFSDMNKRSASENNHSDEDLNSLIDTNLEDMLLASEYGKSNDGDFNEDSSNEDTLQKEITDHDSDTEYDSDMELEPSTEYDSMFDHDEIKELYDSSRKKPVKTSTYVKKEDQYKDLSSSATTFFITSVLGIIFLLLNMVGILNMYQGALPYVVMGIVFAIFLYVGFSSYSKAQKVKSEIKEENQVTDAINDWLSQNVTAELLDSLTTNEATEEIRFFHKLEKMKEMINAKFGELDDSYLDLLVEEYYNNHLEAN